MDAPRTCRWRSDSSHCAGGLLLRYCKPRVAHLYPQASSGTSGTATSFEEGIYIRRQLGRTYPNRILDVTVPLPRPRLCKHYVNLTNGVEAIPQLNELGIQYSFVRIQSTACEQQRFEQLMLELDSDLLMHLALGYSCILYDFGSRSTTLSGAAPRALWYGLEFARYALSRAWLGTPSPAHLRGHNTSAMFEQHYKSFKQGTMKRLRYYKAHAAPGMREVGLLGVYRATEQDSNRQFYTDLLHQHHGLGSGCGSGQAAEQHSTQSSQSQPDSGTAASCVGGVSGLGDEACLDDVVLPRLIGDPGSVAMPEWDASDVAYYRALVQGGYGMYAGGLSHQQFIDVEGKQALTAAA